MRTTRLMKKTYGVMLVDEKDGIWIYLTKVGSEVKIPIARVKDGVVYGATEGGL